MQYFEAVFEDCGSDDGTRGGAVTTLFVGPVSGVDEEFATDVFCLNNEGLYVLSDSDAIFGDDWLWVDGEGRHLAG